MEHGSRKTAPPAIRERNVCQHVTERMSSARASKAPDFQRTAPATHQDLRDCVAAPIPRRLRNLGEY